MPEKWVLKQYQALPLNAKVHMSQARIREWYEHWDGDVCVSFSGGKDSTVLAHLVHDLYPHVPMVFSNTGLEYPEIQSFARKMGAEFIRPKMSFSEVISRYGYPIISKETSEAIQSARNIKKNTNRKDYKGTYNKNKRGELMGTRSRMGSGSIGEDNPSSGQVISAKRQDQFSTKKNGYHFAEIHSFIFLIFAAEL